MAKKYVYTGKIKHYCACCGELLETEWNGRYESDLSSVMQDDSDGFAIVRDRLCGKCQHEENAIIIKKTGKVFKFLAIAVIAILLITGIVLATGYFLNNAVLKLLRITHHLFAEIWIGIIQDLINLKKYLSKRV